MSRRSQSSLLEFFARQASSKSDVSKAASSPVPEKRLKSEDGADEDPRRSKSTGVKESCELKNGETKSDKPECVKTGSEKRNVSNSKDAAERKRRRIICSDDEISTPENCGDGALNEKNDAQYDLDSELSETTVALNSSALVSFNASFDGNSEFDDSWTEDKKGSDVAKFCSEKNMEFKHLSFDFLKPENIRDADRRSPTDPDYDSKMLFVPSDFIKTQTPGLRQWWNIKSKNFDTLLLFKVGKFYELYHMDAVIAVRELNLTFMKGNYAHCGFPEIAYSRFSDQLVERGYKVARIEQTETPEMMEKRNASRCSASKEKVVSREVCRVTSLGTKTYGYMDGEGDDAEAKYLFALCEDVLSATESEIGVCFVDTAVGRVYISQFSDDLQCAALHALFAEFVPAQILFPRKKLSPRITNFLNSYYAAVLKEPLTPDVQFWSDTATLKFLASADYFWDDGKRTDNSGRRSLFEVDGLKNLLSEADPFGVTPKANRRLAVSALGAVVWYLKQCLIDIDVLSLRNFEEVFPETKPQRTDCSLPNNTQKSMIIDGITLKNLNVVADANGSNSEGSLYERLNTCSTTSGRRLLNHWLCHPSCDVETIKQRQNAVADLLKLQDFSNSVAKLLEKTPDLERLLQRIHSLGSKLRISGHPDSRAVLFNVEIYNRRKVNDLLSALETLKIYDRVSDEFCTQAEYQCSSSLLTECLTKFDRGGGFPPIKPFLENFERCFDYERAKKDGVIIPTAPGIDEAFDEAVAGVKSAERSLLEYLKELKIRFSCSTIAYITSGRSRYVLEIPDKSSMKLGSEFEFISQRKGYKRYSTKTLDEMRCSLQSCEEKQNGSLKGILSSVFATFSKNADCWRKAVACISVVDVLMALARYARSIDGGGRCFPDIKLPMSPDDVFISIKEGAHPCASKIRTAVETYIPNDTHIGFQTAGGSSLSSLLLITGPNMGGKTTLMRQVGLITILAHVGSLVPAESCSMTVVDSIFTRIGANDRLAAGQSTFFVELDETSSILRSASRHSLVILDELGRGTATHDGTAVASAVLFELAERVRCRTLFSTHYYSLVHDVAQNPRVSLNHMACAVENDNIETPDDENVTFLYKLETGSCPKSHGFFAAKLAGVPNTVVRRARASSRLVEDNVNTLSLIRCAIETSVDQKFSDDRFIEKLMSVVCKIF